MLRLFVLTCMNKHLGTQAPSTKETASVVKESRTYLLHQDSPDKIPTIYNDNGELRFQHHARGSSDE